MDAAILHFPSPPARPILQPSLHARGARPYLYSGHIDDWHAPGVQVGRGHTSCSVDAAFLVEPVLGRPLRAATMWPGVPGAAERARDYAKALGLAEFQQTGAAFLAERDYAALLDPTGSGKTPQTLAAIEARLSLGIVPTPNTPVVLIVCPALAKRHWQREIKRWTGNDATVLDGLRPGPMPETRYIICNYDILYGARRRDAAGVMHAHAELPGWAPTLGGRFLIAVVDEMHTIRGRNSRRTKALRDACQGVPVVWGLTATPMPNYVRDLWAQLDFLTNGLHGAYWPWAKAYCGATQGKYGWIDTGSDRTEELGQRMQFYMLGRSKAVVQVGMPEKRRETYYVDVEMSAPTVADAQEAIAKSNVVARALRATARAKRPAVVAQGVAALQAKQKVIVFTYLREQAEQIAKAVKAAFECSVQCVNGDMSPEQRDAQATEFRQLSAPAAFIATIDSIGVSISLVGADLMIFADLIYEPWKLIQAEGRGHRFDSPCKLLVRYLIATGTLDEAMVETVISKLATIEAAMGKEADSTALAGMLAPNPAEAEQVVDKLFEKLKAWGARA